MAHDEPGDPGNGNMPEEDGDLDIVEYAIEYFEVDASHEHV